LSKEREGESWGRGKKKKGAGVLSSPGERVDIPSKRGLEGQNGRRVDTKHRCASARPPRQTGRRSGVNPGGDNSCKERAVPWGKRKGIWKK